MAYGPHVFDDDGARLSDRSAALLHTLAMLKANYNEGWDYLANFGPYVADVLREWPSGDPVKPRALRDALETRFAIPPMPINTAEVLRGRAVDKDWIRRDSKRNFLPNTRSLSSVPEVRLGADAVLAHVDWLIERFRVFANNSEHQLDWSAAEASGALERFVEEFSFELAQAKRSHGRWSDDVPDAPLALTMANSFVRRAFVTGDATTLQYLEEMVQGSMLANVLYFHELGSWSEKLPELTVYLDTMVALRVLGLTLEPLADAAQEMVDLLGKLDAKIRIFDHTVEEMHRILATVSSDLRRGELGEGAFSPKFNREVSDAALMRHWTPGDLDEAAADLRRRLRRNGIQVIDSPATPSRTDATKEQLRVTIGEKIPYSKLSSLEKDVESVIGTHVLRRKRECRTLARTPAIFVTNNARLAEVTQEFFEEDAEAASIPHVTTDISLTTQLWVRGPMKGRRTARRFLIAESFAALSGNSTAWDRYLGMIERQRQYGRIDDQVVKTLVGEMESRESFLELTQGQAWSVDEETPLKVLSSLDGREASSIDGPDEPETQEAPAKASADDRDDRLVALEHWKAQREEKDLRRRCNLGRAGFVAALVAAFVLPLAGAITSGRGIALVSSMLLACAVASVCWGYCKDILWGVKTFIAIGAVLAVPVAIYSLAPDGGSSGESKSDGEERSAAEPRSDAAPKARSGAARSAGSR